MHLHIIYCYYSSYFNFPILLIMHQCVESAELIANSFKLLVWPALTDSIRLLTLD